MRFPASFKRQKGSASTDPAIGSDATPTTVAPAASNDNVLTAKLRDINGWPVQRIAVGWTTTAASPVALNGALYLWEETSGHWYLIQSGVSLPPNQLVFFDVCTISEPTPVDRNLYKSSSASNSAGAIEVMLIVTDPGTAVNGVYVFVMGPDLTTVGT